MKIELTKKEYEVIFLFFFLIHFLAQITLNYLLQSTINTPFSISKWIAFTISIFAIIKFLFLVALSNSEDYYGNKNGKLDNPFTELDDDLLLTLIFFPIASVLAYSLAQIYNLYRMDWHLWKRFQSWRHERFKEKMWKIFNTKYPSYESISSLRNRMTNYSYKISTRLEQVEEKVQKMDETFPKVFRDLNLLEKEISLIKSGIKGHNQLKTKDEDKRIEWKKTTCLNCGEIFEYMSKKIPTKGGGYKNKHYGMYINSCNMDCINCTITDKKTWEEDHRMIELK